MSSEGKRRNVIFDSEMPFSSKAWLSSRLENWNCWRVSGGQRRLPEHLKMRAVGPPVGLFWASPGCVGLLDAKQSEKSLIYELLLDILPPSGGFNGVLCHNFGPTLGELKLFGLRARRLIMPDPASRAAKRRWSIENRKHQREIWRAWARKRDCEAMKAIRRKYEADNCEARNLRNRCKVSIAVARWWIAEGHVPPYKRPGWASRAFTPRARLLP